MEDLIIAGTDGTPEVKFSAKTGVLRFSGRANSNNIKLFYRRPDEWLTEYIKDPADTTIVEVNIEYINSVFNKLLLNFLEKSKTVLSKDKKLIVKWYLFPDDEDGQEECDLYSRIINFPFEKIIRS
jgi:hypothetical protein